MAAPEPKTAIRLLTETERGIGDPGATRWSQPTLSAIKELSEVARSLGCTIEFRRPGHQGRRFGDLLATITAFTFASVASSAFFVGEASIYATIERVGGATERRCGIRLPTQPRRMVICRVDSDDLVRELGRYIYQEVVLIGLATWLRHNQELRNFAIHSCTPPRGEPIRDTLQNVYAAGGHAWDGVPDPDAEIAELRGS